MVNTVTVATFNVENLFTRFKFKTEADASEAVKNGFIIKPDAFNNPPNEERILTAKALAAVKADFIGLQEVENLDTLKRFNIEFLKLQNAKYDFPLLIDGNDPRLIDVALLSKLPVDLLRTHQFVKSTSGNRFVFSRDCLEARIKVGTKTLPVFINHLKSMADRADPKNGRANTRSRREEQCEAILQILKDTFGANFGNQDFIVMGDLNDFIEEGKEQESGTRLLLQSDQMENVILRLPKEERWTHFFNGDKTYHQLDYILISKSLAQKNPNVLPVIERRGQPLRVNQPGQPPKVTNFFPEVQGNLKASDHCPVAITLNV